MLYKNVLPVGGGLLLYDPGAFLRDDINTHIHKNLVEPIGRGAGGGDVQTTANNYFFNIAFNPR